jgi:hypothetical protein
MRHLEVKQFVVVAVVVIVIVIIVIVIVVVIVSIIVIHLNILRVVLPDEIVKRCKPGWNHGLGTRVVMIWRKIEDMKTPPEDPNGPLDGIAS